MVVYASTADGEDSRLPVKRARPFLKWAGGKTKLLPEIRALMPSKFGAYHEPFVGAGALYFDLQPVVARISDVNEKLMIVYHALQFDVEHVITLLKHYKNDAHTFQTVRARNFQFGGLAERAADFIFINKTCFNGLMRENKKGQFNVPFGRYDNPTICDEDNLRAVSAALTGRYRRIETAGFRSLETTTDATVVPEAGDFVFCDPPYVPLSATSNFTGYAAGGFGPIDQKDLRDIALRMKRRGVHVLLCNSSAPFVRELYAGKDWEMHEVKVARSINSKADKRGNVTELLIR